MLLWVLASNPARQFYEAMGGRVVGVKSERFGDTILKEIAYGWRADELKKVARIQARPRGS